MRSLIHCKIYLCVLYLNEFSIWDVAASALEGITSVYAQSSFQVSSFLLDKFKKVTLIYCTDAVMRSRYTVIHCGLILGNDFSRKIHAGCFVVVREAVPEGLK